MSVFQELSDRLFAPGGSLEKHREAVAARDWAATSVVAAARVLDLQSLRFCRAVELAVQKEFRGAGPKGGKRARTARVHAYLSGAAEAIGKYNHYIRASDEQGGPYLHVEVWKPRCCTLTVRVLARINRDDLAGLARRVRVGWEALNGGAA